MASFRIVLKSSVEKDLRKINEPFLSRVLEKVEALAVAPFPAGYAKLAGSEHLYRVRVGDYRIVYQVSVPDAVIVVIYIRHRKEVYRDL